MWKRGQWFALCDVCGFKFLSGQLRERWDGLMVDDACWETRHPQEFVKSVKEATIPWSRPDNDGINISPNEYVDAFYFINYNPNTGFPDSYVTRDGI
jgi:hypothetical protein